MKKKILIIGAGVEQVPAVIEAKKLGLTTIVTDMNPKGPAIKFADSFYHVSTTDVQGNIFIAKSEKISGVTTVASETAVITVAAVAQELNLPSFSITTALKATNKEEMRKALSKFNIKVSPYIIAEKIEDIEEYTSKVQGPWVFKPIDSSGQRGTTIINDKKFIESSFNNAINFSNAKKVLVDKYIAGPEIHVTMFVINGKVHFLAISDRITLNNQNFGIAVRHIAPSDISPKLEDEIKDICTKSVKAIGLENGVATCELIIKEQPYLMEIAVRTPGGYLREVALYTSGIDIIKATILQSLGQLQNIEQAQTNDYYNAVSVKFISKLNLPANITTITKVQEEKISNEEDIKLVNFHFTGNFKVPELQSSVGRFAVIISVGKNRKEAVKTSEDKFNNIKFNNENLLEYTTYGKYNVNFKDYLK